MWSNSNFQTKNWQYKIISHILRKARWKILALNKIALEIVHIFWVGYIMLSISKYLDNVPNTDHPILFTSSHMWI